MPEINNEMKRVLDFASDKFMQEGFYKTSMDSLASELRISKKTIYKHFSSKEELVEAIVINFITSTAERIESVVEQKDDSITKALHLFEIMRAVATKLSDNWVKDIRIHMPELWVKIDEFRTKKAYKVLGNIIEQGQQEDMFVDKPAELIIHLFVTALRSIVNPDFLYYQKMNYKEAIQYTFEILFNGILTPKGKKHFNKIFSKVIQ